jgi:hypothetical protein
MVSGTLKSGANNTTISEGKLNGTRITFTAGGVRYSGRVNGDRIEGTAQASAGGSTKWSATRAPAVATQKPGAHH